MADRVGGAYASLQAQVEQLTRELAGARAEQAATRDVLRVIARSPSKLQDVLDAIAERAARLCGGDGAIIHLVRGDRSDLVARVGWQPGPDRVVSVPISRDYLTGRAVIDRKAVHVHDLMAAAEGEFPGVRRLQEEVPERATRRTVLAVPMLTDTEAAGAIMVARREVRPFTDEHIALLESFADQAVIAIENARLFQQLHERNRELSESLDQQTATANVLKAISRTAFDLQAILDTLAENAARLTNADGGLICRAEGDRLPPVAAFGPSETFVKMITNRPPTFDRGSITGRAALERRPVRISDVLTDPEYRRTDLQGVEGYHSLMAVPLLRGDELYGVMAVVKYPVEPFTDRQLELIQTFADQAVIAIENARLFGELQDRNRDLAESLAQQTAIREILEVITSSPTDVQPILDAIVARAEGLLGNGGVVLWLVDGDECVVRAFGPQRQQQAVEHDPDNLARLGLRVPLTREGIPGRAILEGRPIRLPDVQNYVDPDYPDAFASVPRRGGVRSLVTIPLFHADQAIGCISTDRCDLQPFSDREIALLETFARQAAIAVANTNLFHELQQRNRDLAEALERQTVTAEVLEVIGRSPTDLQKVLDTIAESAARLCETDLAAILLVQGNTLNAVAGLRRGDGLRFTLADPVPIGPLDRNHSAPERAIVDREVIHVHDLTAVPIDELDMEYPRRIGIRTALAVPLLRQGVGIGAVSMPRLEVRPYSEQQIALIKTFADQAVIAITNAELFSELQRKLAEQTAIGEILAAIGRSPTEIEPVLGAIVQNAARLIQGESASIHLVRGEEIVAEEVFDSALGDRPISVATALALTAERGWDARAAVTFPLQRGFALARVVLDRTSFVVPDSRAWEPDTSADEGLRQFHLARGLLSWIAVPLQRTDTAIGALSVLRPQPSPFSEDQIQLLQTFADQAVIALENSRLFRELGETNLSLREALEQQRATAEVLQIISRSAFDVRTVLQTLAESAVRLCDADSASVAGVKDGVLTQLASTSDWVPIGEQAPLTEHSLVGRVVAGGRTVHIPDLLADESFEHPFRDKREMPRRSGLGVPLQGKDGSLIGVFILFRNDTPRPFTESQIALVQTFADQAVIAIENARLLQELQDRNRDLAESLAQQTAVREILEVITSSPTDVQPVLDAVVARAETLLGNGGVDLFLVEGDACVLRARGPRILGLIAQYDPDGITRIGVRPALTRESSPGRAIVEARTIHVPDLQSYVDPEYPDAFGRVVRRIGVRSLLAVPLVQADRAIGCISVHRFELQPFTDREIALLETFARQAAIAVANTNLFHELQQRNRDLAEALEQQTATADILRVIASSPTDFRESLRAIAETAARLCDAPNAVIQRLESDLLITVGGYSSHPRSRENIEATKRQGIRGTPATPRTSSGRALLERRTIHTLDMAEAVKSEFPDSRKLQEIQGYRSEVVTPLLRGGEAIGLLDVLRFEVRPFTDKQIKLLETFADQAVIAIENARLFQELQQRLAERTAMAEVLEAISRSPTDLQRVLDTITASMARLWSGTWASILRVVGDEVVFVAHRRDGEARTPPSYHLPRSREWVGGRAIVDRQTVHAHDLAASLDEFPLMVDIQREAGLRTLLATPLLRNGTAIGAIHIALTEVRPFSSDQIALLESFANQAVIAISNAELFEQLQNRTRELAESVEQLKAVFEVGQAVSSTLDLGALLDTIAARAVELSGADGGGIFELDEETQRLELRTSYRQSSELIDVLRREPLRVGEGVAGRAVATREPVQVPDATVEGAYQSSVREILLRTGFRALLAVPLLREQQVLGALVVNRGTPGEFAPEIVELLKTFASQSAIALQNARLFQELAEKNRALELAGRHKSQFLANMSHELRTPLNAILGYTELILDGIYGNVPDEIREILGRVEVSGRHLLGLINAVLDLSKIEAGQLSLALADYSLAEVVRTVAAGVESLAAEKGLALEVAIAPELPIGHGDERRLSQVLLNLVGNAIKFTESGKVRVSASVADGQFVVAVSDTGPGIAEADQQRIFEEFQQLDESSTREKGGTGLGLAIARRIVELHGGRIRVESAVGQGSTFTFEVPVRVTSDE